MTIMNKWVNLNFADFISKRGSIKNFKNFSDDVKDELFSVFMPTYPLAKASDIHDSISFVDFLSKYKKENFYLYSNCDRDELFIQWSKKQDSK